MTDNINAKCLKEFDLIRSPIHDMFICTKKTHIYSKIMMFVLGGQFRFRSYLVLLLKEKHNFAIYYPIDLQNEGQFIALLGAREPRHTNLRN